MRIHPHAVAFALLIATVATAPSTHAAPPAPPATPPPADPNIPVLIPDMRATGQFFSGALTVDIRFGRMQRPPRIAPTISGTTPDTASPNATPGTTSSDSTNPDDKPNNNNSSGKGKGGKSGGHGKGRSRSDASGNGGMPPSGDPDERRPNIREERNPATQFHIALTNHGSTPLAIEVLDFDSALGNFAVKPDKITIAPGQTAQTDPMISRLGVPTENLPIKIRVSNGAASESQTLTLAIQPQ